MTLARSILARKAEQRELVKKVNWKELNLNDRSVIFAMPHRSYEEVYLIEVWPNDNAALWTADASYATIIQLEGAHEHLDDVVRKYRPKVVAKSAKGLLMKVNVDRS